MKKEALVIFFLLVLILSFGCQRALPSDAPPTEKEYRIGSQGLMMLFVPNNPPERVYAGDRFDIAIEYTNMGAARASGFMYLSGYDPNYIGIDNPREIIDIEGKSVFSPDRGETHIAEFAVDRLVLPSGVDWFDQTFLATACYAYETIATAKVCIDPDPYGALAEEKVCFPVAQGTGTQGAPVAVTNIEEDALRGRVQFRLTISNVGGGTVISPNAAVTDCHARLDRKFINKVEITEAFFSDYMLKCEPMDESGRTIIRLDTGTGTAYCYTNIPLDIGAYETLLTIKLNYIYRDSMEKRVRIIQSPTYLTYR
ncbi:hypothetical protein KY339_03920 [Candidatus Woesearchaeota archaeon]|nr:hypothetical protein [Candidatus Woesearchaeota archaeon]